MELFKTESGIVYHTYMYEGRRVVFFMDRDDAKALNLEIYDFDEFCHAAVDYEDIKEIPVEKYKDLLWWPQCKCDEGDDCEIVKEVVTAEDASTDEKFLLFCSKAFYEFEAAWDNEEIV